MNDFKKTDFVITGNESHLGPEYGNYWTMEIKHKTKGTTADVLLDPDGNLIESANDITDLIRKNFTLNGNRAKIIPMSIEGNKMLILKLPEIKQP